MNTDGALELANIERKLRREATAFKERAHLEECPNAALKHSVCSLLRVASCDLEAEQTLRRLEAMLSAQRRWSRIRHTAYDINRHILLDRVVKQLGSAPHCSR